jgi:hypothetical protein
MVSALNGLRLYSRRVDQAAERIASAGLFSIPDDTAAPPETPPGPATPTAADPGDLGDAMVSMMVAQRAFAAQIRVLKTADQMRREVVDLPADFK